MKENKVVKVIAIVAAAILTIGGVIATVIITKRRDNYIDTNEEIGI